MTLRNKHSQKRIERIIKQSNTIVSIKSETSSQSLVGTLNTKKRALPPVVFVRG